MPSLAGNGYHDPKNEGLNHGSHRMLTPLVSTNSPAWPRNVICTREGYRRGRAGRRRAPGRAVAYHCGTAARGARLAHVRRLRDGRHDARGLRSRVGDLRRRPGSRCSPTTPSTMRTRSRRRWSATTRSGHTCSTAPDDQRDVEFTVGAPLGLGDTVLAAWHASYVRDRDPRPGVRLAGFMTAEIASDGRIEPLPRVDALRPTAPARARKRRIDGRRCLIRRRQRLRRAGAAQRARPGPARGPARATTSRA